MDFAKRRVPVTDTTQDIRETNNNEAYDNEAEILGKVRQFIEKTGKLFDVNGKIGLKDGNDGMDSLMEQQESEDEMGSNYVKLVGTDMNNNRNEGMMGKNKIIDFLCEYDHQADEDYDTDLENEEDEAKSYIDEQREKYIIRCQRLGIPPVTLVLNGLTKPKLNLSHQGLRSVGLRALVPMLKSNTFITELDLKDNDIDEEGIRLVAKILIDNLFISHLDISMNNINASGLEELLKSLSINKYVKHLNMSKTGLKDKHASMLSNMIRENGVITILLLHGNEFSAAGGVLIGCALPNNNTISYLDLSWNHIRYAGATAIGQALKQNSSLVTMNLAWNGFCDNGAEAIAKALLTNGSLQELDLSYNRITDKGSTALADSLKVNRCVKKLKMNWNAIRSDGVSALVNAIDKNDHSKITELQLNGVVINGVCKAEIDALLLKRLQLQIYYGGVTNSSAMSTNMNKIRREIVEIITTYLSKNRLRMLDLFNQWDKDKSLTLTRSEFRKGIKSCKIPISEIQLYFMLEWLDQDGNDEIEYNEFVAITEVE